MYFIAHRGEDNHKYISNTTKALISSLDKEYINGVELDIRMTKDKKIVIFHNFLIDDKNHPIRPVSTLTYQQIKKYNIGTDNNVDHVSLLETFLKKVKDTNKKILVEIKEESNDYKEIIKEVINIIDKYDLNYYICSFNYSLIKYIKKNYPKYKVGLLIGFLINDNRLYNEFDFVSITINYLEKWDFSKETFVWTINKESDLKKLLNYSYDIGVITDRSYKLEQYLKQIK